MTFSEGCQAMARDCLAEIERIEAGECTVAQMKEWLKACLANDERWLKQQQQQKNPKV